MSSLNAYLLSGPPFSPIEVRFESCLEVFQMIPSQYHRNAATINVCVTHGHDVLLLTCTMCDATLVSVPEFQVSYYLMWDEILSKYVATVLDHDSFKNIQDFCGGVAA